MIAPNPTLLTDYFCQVYRPERLAHGRSDRPYKCALEWFAAYLQAEPTIDAANLDRVAAFQTWLVSTRLIKTPTARTYAHAVTAILRHANQPAPLPAGELLPGTLGHFLAAYLATRGDVKGSTKRHLERAACDLLDYFGSNRPLGDITPGDADEFKLHLLSPSGRGLAANTARRTCGRAKQFFRAAVRKRLVDASPFADMHGCHVRANRERFYFVTRDEAQKVLIACPNVQWRVLFALARFGGLRNPSETLVLRWSDVDFARGRMHVRSPKTEHIEGHESRDVPIFVELRPHLEAARAEAGDAEHVVTLRHRETASIRANLRYALADIIRNAGLTPWPKVFQNLRATRQTELSREFPEHVVCTWLGNSRAVATEHYLRTTDEDFERASGVAQRRGIVGRLRGLLKGGAA